MSIKTKNSYQRYAVYATLFLFLGIFLYFALLADAFYNGGDSDPQPATAEIAPSLPLEINRQQAEEIVIQHPLNGTKSGSQIMQVEGRAPHNSMIGIYVNGTLTDSTVVNGGSYRFPHVVLTKNTNVLQTRFFADNGSSDSSNAIMVFYEHSIASNENVFFQNSPANISRGNLNRKELVLTFDGDLEANSCEAILKTLEEANVRSTIFLTKRFIERFPDFTRRIAANHEVGHRLSGRYFMREEFSNELLKTEQMFQRITGKKMSRLWRAPFAGEQSQIRKFATELGYIHVAWTANSKTLQNMDSLDSVSNPGVPSYFPALFIKERLLSFGQNEPEQANGSVILMHLGSRRHPGDRLDPWLPEIIRTFEGRGYRFITIGEMIKRT